MTVIEQQKLLFRTECLQSKCYIELISAHNLTIAWSDSKSALLIIKRWELHYKLILQSECRCQSDLNFVINFAKFGVDRSQDLGRVSSQILGFCLYLRSRAIQK